MGVALARKLRSRFEGTERGGFFTQLAGDVKADLDSLDVLMASIQVRQNMAKQAGAWLGERVSRLKLNPWFNGSERLTVLLEIEMLALGVEGKLSMWRSLLAIADSTPELKAAPLDELVTRAEQQRSGLEQERLRETLAVLS